VRSGELRWNPLSPARIAGHHRALRLYIEAIENVTRAADALDEARADADMEKYGVAR
jgi:hypothetical protein